MNCVWIEDTLLHHKNHNRRTSVSKTPYEFLMVEDVNNPNCPYKSFKFYLTKIQPSLLTSDVVVFLNPERHTKEDEYWFTRPLLRARRNYFNDLRRYINQVSDDYSAENPLKWEKDYSNHSQRVLCCTTMQRAGVNKNGLKMT